MSNLADPRSSSTHSLLPSSISSSEPADTRRTLLVVYIHGFMGNDSSFRSFPAHVHNYLKEALVDTHVIHTKIYPRYKTYRSIEVACENFSRWLAPHESSTTDVVLTGHSMGGLLAADVVLKPSNDYSRNAAPFRHRILGILCLDAPLLGLHPGIVLSGIASLFRPAPTSPAAVDGKADHALPDSHSSGALSPDPSIYEQVRPPSGAPSPSLAPVQGDPTYNPAFFNDVAFVDRGWLKNIAHFAHKYKQENLVEAATKHIMSHLEFGGCLADYPGLRTRYTRVRMLEDVDELTNTGENNLVRVRFANYYTVSTGLPKKPKPGKSSDRESTDINQANSSSRPSSLGTKSPRISIEDYSSPQEQKEGNEEEDDHPLELLEPMPIIEEDHQTRPSGTNISSLSLDGSPTPGPDSDSIPPLPTAPVPPDLSSIPDKDARKAAEKEYKAAKKACEQSLKDREKAIKSQQKLLEKARKESEKSRKEAEKQEKEFRKAQKKSEEKSQKKSEEKIQKQEDKLQKKEEKKIQKQEDKLQKKEEEKKRTTTTPNKKPKKLGKFCMLPPGGENDKTWVQVYMQDMDEVTAHCGLFFADRPDYERLVGDVGEMIAGWVREDESRRVLLEEIGRVD
ncbi:hypothetical protein QBC43DRAFT_200447 [Cladorrhinum sp. PSN259]|nr:hypothetical protein QBC43DRAFT_200447 [Cladorrhinum sp. PSN259]